MGVFVKLLDLILVFFFFVISVFAPFNDAQVILPLGLFPDFLIRIKNWYVREYDDYLLEDTPHFFVGVLWLELLCHWPLSLVNIYGLLCNKSWVNTTCFTYGVSGFTCMVAILAEMIGSGSASDKLKTMYFPFVGFCVLSILRGFIPHSGKNISAISKKSALAGKKKA